MAEPRNVTPALAGRSNAKAADSAGLSPRTVELVRKSWSAVMPISDAAASLFYERLFELDPSVRPLFKNDMREQKKKLMQTIAVAVDGIVNMEKLVPVLKSLGARHVGYMVEDRHYDTVGEALLWTLKEGLGDAFTPEVKRAWTEVYGVLARVMKQGAAEAGRARSPAPRVDTPVRFTVATPASPTPAVRPASRGGAVVVGVGKSLLDLPPDSAHPAGRTLVGVAATTPVPPSPGDGPFSPRQIELVQKSWSQVLPISDAAASLFYERLFEIDPSTRPLFKNDMREQKKKLMQTLTVAVDGLSNVPRLLPTLQALGKRHAGYMVEERHYDTVGAALLWTLKEGLGNLFTPEVEAAWKAVYGTVADVMKKAAAHQESAPAAPVTPQAGSRSDDDETQVKRPARKAAPPPPPDADHDMPTVALATLRPGAPEALAATAALAAITPPAAAAPPQPDNRPIIVHLDGQSLPPLQVRVAIDAPSPYLHRGREAEAPAPAPAETQGKDGLVAGVLLGTLCLVASMVASGIAVLASAKTVSPIVLLGLPLGTLALTVAAFAFGALWGRSRGGTAPRKP